MPLKSITFTDLRDFEVSRRNRLLQELAELEARKKKDGVLPPRFEERLKEVARLAGKPIVDPVFVELQQRLGLLSPPRVGDHKAGKFPSSIAAPTKKLTVEEIRLAAIYGILQLENVTQIDASRFATTLPKALGEYVGRQALYDAILSEFINDGDIGQNDEINARQWIAVGRQLAADNITANDTLLPLKVRASLARVSGASDGAPTSTLEIIIPDLEAHVDQEIVVDNLLAMQSLYFAMILDEMKLFHARDLAMEQWQLGMLVVGRGGAGDKFYDMWRKTPFRFSEVERQSLASRCFGYAGGETVHGSPNRGFKTLWMRFLSTVSSFTRKFEVDTLLRSSLPGATSQELVRQAGRDLAANMSLHGFGIAYFAAKEQQQEIDDIIALLSDPEVLQAYGARDLYQAIEQLIMFSGGQVENSLQKRITAHSGAVIIRWLANRAGLLASNSLETVLDVNSLLNPLPPVPGHRPTADPSDADMVNAVEQWIAVNGIQDQFIEENAQAMEPPRTPSRPIQIPSMARDVLESVGISAGLANGNGQRRGRLAQAHGNYARP